jgi:leucyl aminopeptidase (aminopeptidase T)
VTDAVNRTAAIAVEKCMGVRESEKVLIVTDAYAERVGQALYGAAARITKQAYLLKIPFTEVDGAEPAKETADFIKKFDVVLCPTKHSLTHTKAVKSAVKKGARIVTLPGITEEMFVRAIDIDYNELKERCRRLSELLGRSSRVTIATRSGTDFRIDVRKARPIEDNGDYTGRRADAGNLPSGEVFLAPKDSAGIIVIDHLGDLCKPKTKVAVRNNTVQEAFDKDFAGLLWKYKNARNIAELGIGLNPKAILSGSTLEDEKVLGTCHIAFGSNFDFGGKVKADVHWDAILLKPTIYFDEKKIMDEGDLLV